MVGTVDEATKFSGIACSIISRVARINKVLPFGARGVANYTPQCSNHSAIRSNLTAI